jgi:hypothetical protein
VSGNGNLTSAELDPASGGIPGPDPGQGQLASSGAAAAWNSMAEWARKNRGVQIRPNGSDSLYRPYSRQVYWRNYWCGQGACGNAATPGTSNHGWGNAGDLPSFVYAICDSQPQFKWSKPCSDAPWESWHRKFCGGWSGGDPGGSGPKDPYPTLKRGDRGGAVKRAQQHLRRWNLGLTRPKADGDFGDRTKKAVRDFQVCHGLKPDGVIGDRTWQDLRRRDYLLDDERSHVNRIKRKRHGGINAGERDKVRNNRDWCARRARSILEAVKQTGWGVRHRRERFHVLRKMAGKEWKAD